MEESATVTQDTRGIMRPEGIGHAFSLERPRAPADLEQAVDRHWLVQWDLRGRPAYRSEVLTHPAVHLVLEPHGAFVYGVRRSLNVRILSGRGYAAGTKFLPGGFARLIDGPVSDLTDRAVALGDLFGADGARLADEGAAQESLDDKLALVQAFLRERLPEPGDDALLVRAVVADMAGAEPGRRVDEIAATHGVSTRTLQRLFARYVGVGPKWVLQRHRLHTALEEVNRGARTDWTRLALDLGYFDHAHFIRDFRAVAGRTPAQYERERAAA